ncbi:MAG: cupin, partial [Actinomycetota bacterium]|nr:cupin [Actinomycetota bacterium]
SASVFSKEVLAASFGVPAAQLPQFPFTAIDPLIVGRPNPLDPVQ